MQFLQRRDHSLKLFFFGVKVLNCLVKVHSANRLKSAIHLEDTTMLHRIAAKFLEEFVANV